MNADGHRRVPSADKGLYVAYALTQATGRSSRKSLKRCSSRAYAATDDLARPVADIWNKNSVMASLTF